MRPSIEDNYCFLRMRKSHVHPVANAAGSCKDKHKIRHSNTHTFKRERVFCDYNYPSQVCSRAGGGTSGQDMGVLPPPGQDRGVPPGIGRASPLLGAGHCRILEASLVSINVCRHITNSVPPSYPDCMRSWKQVVRSFCTSISHKIVLKLWSN